MGGLIEKLNQLDVLERQKVILKSKKISDFYIDIKKAYGFPEILNEITDRLYALIPKEANCIAASDYGGLPLATAISSKYGLNLTLIRNKKKNHGGGDLRRCETSGLQAEKCSQFNGKYF